MVLVKAMHSYSAPLHAAGVAAHAVGCVHVLGVSLPARNWMPLAAEGVAASQQSAAQRTAALVVLAALLHASCKAGADVDVQNMQLAASALVKAQQAVPVSASGADEAGLQQQLQAACSNLVHWAGRSSVAVAPQLFQVLLHLWAAEHDSQVAALTADVAAKSSTIDVSGGLTATAALAQLAAALDRPSPADLCGQYGLSLLQHGIQVGWLQGCVCLTVIL